MKKSFVVFSIAVAVFAVGMMNVAFAVYEATPSGFPTDGQYGPPAGIPSGFPTDGQFGPPANIDELMNKGAGMQQAGLARMKKATSGMKKAIIQMEKTIEKVKKAGYGVSQDIIDSLAKGKAAVETIETTSDMDAALTALDDFNAFIDVLDENIENLNVLANFPRILKQAERTYDKLVKNFEKMKAKTANSDVDLSESIKEIQTTVDSLKTVMDQAKELAVSGKSEDAFTKLEKEYFEPMESAFQSVGMLQAATNIGKAVKSVAKGIASAEKIAAKLAKKGTDVTAARKIIADSKAKLEQLKVMVKVKGFEPEPAVDLLEQLNDLRDSFENAIEEASGQSLHGAKTIDFFNVKVPAVPKEFKNGIPTGEPGDSGFDKMDFGF